MTAREGVAPYNLYGNRLDSVLGKGAAGGGDYERLTDPAIAAGLARLAGASTVAAQTAALVPIERYVAANLPVIPITTASDRFEYSSQHWWAGQHARTRSSGAAVRHQQQHWLWHR